MPDVLTQSHLARNLECFGERNRDVAEAIRSAGTAPSLHWTESRQDALSATLDGRRLASAHRPLDEAERITNDIDMLDNAVVVVLGFGLGYHVRRLAENMGKSGVIVVFEPDVDLLRAVFERVDHSSWMADALVVWMTDPGDRTALATKLGGAESIVAQGVAILEHPASRDRLGEAGATFSGVFSDFVSNAKTTLVTTLVRSSNTIANLLSNIDHYAAGPGIEDLRHAARGRPAVVVSAGPSLRKNMHLLAEPGVRDRCVIIAVQTTLKPLLAAGIRPHFVTALDYHEISSRFYEGLTAEDVAGVTLVAEPKAHPVIIDSFPGIVRCCGSGFLDKVLGPLAREMGSLPAGATVAHLALYLGRHLGCNPIAFIGQDLGFTDGLYYARGTAIHDIWATEINPFNTIEMMEWQRIVRHRTHLEKATDHDGKSVYTDAQMLNYLQQFQRDFAVAESDGVRIIDASEGGVIKQHAEVMPLATVIERFATEPLPELPVSGDRLESNRIERVKERLTSVRRDIVRLQGVSRRTVTLLHKMLRDQGDEEKMARHFSRMEKLQGEVKQVFEAFELLNLLNQLGVFKRHRSDRKIHLSKDLPPLQRQRAQLERDMENVSWTVDAADDMIGLLDGAQTVLSGESTDRDDSDPGERSDDHAAPIAAAHRVAALIPVDPDRNGLGHERSLVAEIASENVLQATLMRLGRSTLLESIILIAPEGFDVDAMIDRSRIDLPVHIERCDGSPFPGEQESIAAARLWTESCWRGGLAGMSVYDEVLCPQAMAPVMERHDLAAAVLVAPDWPLIDVSRKTGCDALVGRYLQHPEQHRLVFTQAPPGLGGCLVARDLMTDFVKRNRLSTIGAMLVYQPHAPQHDPIARDANVPVDPAVRRSFVRATCDSPAQHARILAALNHCPRSKSLEDWSPGEVVAALEAESSSPSTLPAHVVLELTTERVTTGRYHAAFREAPERPPLTADLARSIFEQLGSDNDAVVTFAGLGDPLLHPQFDAFAEMAKAAGVRGVHLRTALLCDQATLDRILAAPIDIVSVELHADRAQTYETMMGADRFKQVLLNMDHLLLNRRKFTGQKAGAALGLPWIVPRLQRRIESYEDIDTFFDRWLSVFGTCVIEGPPPVEPPDDVLASALAPERVMLNELHRRLTIHADGAVPVSELDFAGANIVGNLADDSLPDLWRALIDARTTLRQESGDECVQLRTAWP